jgi:hypothetical protein
MKYSIIAAASAVTVLLAGCGPQKPEVTPEEARAIAKEAYIYGNPMVDHYRVFYSYFLDPKGADFKAPLNTIYNNARVYTDKDVTIQTPNSDTPYSYGGLDLRSEPIVISVPKMEEDRYFSIQLVDGFTHNFHFIGTRTTGNGGGNFLLVGPDWKGEKPEGILEIIRAETHIVFALIRTQLFSPEDIENVKAIQAGYNFQPLSTFLNQPVPPAAAAIDWLAPLGRVDQDSSLMFFNQLNFWMQFCSIHASEKELYERFAKIGIAPGQVFDPNSISPEIQAALAAGIQDAWMEFKAFNESDIVPGKVGSADVFGTRDYLQNNYLYRMAGAVLGIYGLSKEEAIYPIYQTDADGQPLNAATHNYTLTLTDSTMPPVNAFWSFTMYELPARLLTANSLNRFLINSPMLPDLKRNPDNSITLYIQHESPGKDKESNWLPAPNGPFFFVNRLYMPKPEAFNGTWKPIPLKRSL